MHDSKPERIAVGVVMLLQFCAALLLAASVAVNFANIIGRYFFHAAIPWAEEVMLFLMIGCVFLSCGVVGWAGGQIRMDAFVSALPARARAVMEVASDVALIATSVLLVILAWPVVAMLTEFDQRSQAANFPLAIPQAALPVGFGLMAILIAIRLFVGKHSRPKPPQGD